MIVLRSLLFVCAFYLWSAVVAIVCTPLLLGPAGPALRMFSVWARGIFWLLKVCCGVRVELRGREHMPSGPALVASKHQCMFDVFAQFAWLPRTCYVMKQELMWIPWFGWYAAKVKSIVVDRQAHSNALRKLVREARDRFAEQRQVVIFPEGTRTEPGAPGDYKPGIAALYRELGTTVYPVATNSGAHWPRKGFLRHPGVIVFEYLEPIEPGLKRAEFMRTLEERIETASLRLLRL